MGIEGWNDGGMEGWRDGGTGGGEEGMMIYGSRFSPVCVAALDVLDARHVSCFFHASHARRRSGSIFWLLFFCGFACWLCLGGGGRGEGAAFTV